MLLVLSLTLSVAWTPLQEAAAPSVEPLEPSARLRLSEHPSDLRLYPRDEGGLGTLVVAGTWRPIEGSHALRLEVSGDGTSLYVDARPFLGEQGEGSLALAGPPVPFHLQVQVPAGLIDYQAFLVLRQGKVDTILETWDSIAVGDILLLQGQSNAVAGDYWAEQVANNLDQNPWVRSFGTASLLPNEVSADTAWHLGDGESFNVSGSIGAWGLDLADKIVRAEGIPVAVLNGAVGGTLISQHQRDDLQPEDLDTIYGRLLWRARQAGVDQKARAMFYYQGESDASDALGWITGFRDLLRDWEVDFPGLEHLWVVQVRKGCGAPSLELRDHQRRVAHRSPQFHNATANGLPGHDWFLCHFFYEGYEDLGRQLGPQVAHHLYGHPEQPDAEAPDILSATWEGPSQDAFFLDFRNVTGNFQVPVGSWDSLSISDGTPIQGVTAVGNRLRVQLTAASAAASVSFDGTSGGGSPWIRNAQGHAPLSFFEVPIQ